MEIRVINPYGDNPFVSIASIYKNKVMEKKQCLAPLSKFNEKKDTSNCEFQMELKMWDPFISSGRFIKERNPIVSSGAIKKIGEQFLTIYKKKPTSIM